MSNTDNNIKNYWEKRLNDNYGLQGTGYIGLGKKYNAWMYRVRKKVVLKKLNELKFNYKDADVLDIGSGSGFYIDIWNKIGVKSLMGCDITSISIKNLKNMYPNREFLELDISSNMIPISKKFDFISAFDVLFHIVDDDKYATAIKNIYNLLKPGGLLMFSENFVHTKSLHNPYQSTRSLYDIQSLLIESGFLILERSPMFYFMNAPVDSTSILINKFWNLIKRVVYKGEKLGSITGSLLYLLEIAMVSLKKESPSTELMICRKP